MGDRAHGATAKGIAGGFLAVVIMLATVTPGLAQLAKSGAEGPVPPETGALVLAVSNPAASEEWWTLAQAEIQADLNSAEPDGLSTTADWSVTGQADGDRFGYSVASAGDVNGDGYADVIVGAPDRPDMFSEGKVYAFYGSSTGLSTTANWSWVGVSSADLGYSVAGAGDVNGDGYDDVVFSDPLSGDGFVYLFFGSTSGLSSTWDWRISSEDGYTNFGRSVAGAGDVNGDGYADILIGANYYGDNSNGIVYAYYGGPSGPGTTPNWSVEGEAGYYLGHAVAGAGDVNGDGYADVIVSSISALSLRGVAYVYHGSASGLARSPNRTYTGENIGDRFGWSVAGAGDVNGDGYADILVGATGYDGSGGNDTGRVYGYFGSSGGSSSTPDWSLTGMGAGWELGRSVAGAGDVNGDGYADVVLGGANLALLVYGAAQGFSAGSWHWSTVGENDGDEFGFSVAGAGDVNGDGYADVMVGAYGYVGGANLGKVYAYHGTGDPPSTVPVWNEQGTDTGDEYGWRVASAGDVNGDGYSDLLVGAPGYPAPFGQGRVYLYLGSSDGLATNHAWSADGEQDGDRFGASLAAAGDVNGDGYADVLIGTEEATGKVYVYYGVASGLQSTPAWTAVGEQNGTCFGCSLDGAGDVNGDGYADVSIGAKDGGSSSRGKVYVYHGGEAGLSTAADWTAVGEGDFDRFGTTLAGAGDVNGDGYADVVIGTPRAGDQQGKAYVYHGSPSGLGAMAAWSVMGLDPNSYVGYAVAGVGDVNGDGYADVLVSALLPPAGDNTGKVYLYTGSATGLGITAAWSKVGENIGDWFGHSMGAAGDVNGDGYADVVIGAFGYSGNRGKIYLYLGQVTGLRTTASMTDLGDVAGDELGYSVAGAGDINGDGFAEIVAGARYGEGTMVINIGEAVVYLGNARPGQLVLARPMRQDSTMIHPWALADAPDMFLVRMGATNPAGRARVKLEVEACPPGVAFGSVDCTRAVGPTWQDTVPVSGLPLPRLLGITVAGLESETLYRWRARVLYAPYMVLRAGITPPPNPAHGPWRRFQAQAFEADVRTAPALPNDLPTVFLPIVVRNR